MNQVLHQQRRPATVLSIAALVVMVEREWDGVEVSVLQVSVEQLPALRAALGEHGRLDVLGTTGRTCTVAVWSNDPLAAPTGGGDLCQQPGVLPAVAAILPDLEPEVRTERVSAGAGAAGTEPSRRRLRPYGNGTRVMWRARASRRAMAGGQDPLYAVGEFPAAGDSWTAERASRRLVGSPA